MTTERTKISDASGKEYVGSVVRVTETTERFSDVTFDDGTTIRIKAVVTEAVRADNEWDAEGNPIYVVRSANIITVSHVEPEFKRKVQ